MSIAIKKYYQAFSGIRVWLFSIPFLTLMSHSLKLDSSFFNLSLFPPLGEVENLTILATIAMLLATTYLVYQYCESRTAKTKRLLICCAAGIVVGITALIFLYAGFVVRVPISGADSEVLVSVGWERTPLALSTYPGYTKQAMLHDSGPWEDRISALWTTRSIWTIRTLLWLAYSVVCISFISLISLMAYKHASENP
ncbi:MAG TPA: hypothetical protein VG893_14625 [Terracidiphilus sp.]|nr:hypothetical protein [Terracidiphilus sp.]